MSCTMEWVSYLYV